MKLSYDRFKFEFPTRDLLFIAVSGSHSYGTNRPDSDLDLRAVTMPNIRDVLRIDGNVMQNTKRSIHEEIDIEIVPIVKWLRIILKGNGNYLENLWQPKVFPIWGKMNSPSETSKVHMIRELQSLVMEHGLSKRFRNHYLGFARSQQKDFYQKWKTKCLLYTYRVLMSGIVLYKDNIVEYDLRELLKICPSSYVQMLMDRYDSEQSIMNDAITRDVQAEFDIMEEVLHQYADESELPDKPDYEPFNEWLYNYYAELL